MEFLKEVLGDGFAAFSETIDAYNNAHPESPVKLANLESGAYVSKRKYADLEAEVNKLKDAQKETDEIAKKRYEDEIAALKNEILNEKFNGKVNQELVRHGVKNITCARALLDEERIKKSENADEALSAAITEMKKENGFLFSDANLKTGMRQGETHEVHDAFISSIRSGAGL